MLEINRKWKINYDDNLVIALDKSNPLHNKDNADNDILKEFQLQQTIPEVNNPTLVRARGCPKKEERSKSFTEKK